MFLLPMYVGAAYAARRPIEDARRRRMIEYFTNVQLADGGIGLHAEAREGSMFTTALSYVALRLLGVASDDPRTALMRAWIAGHGTPLGAAPWGKLVLCTLNLYDWRGVHPVPPEVWLLPYAGPVHPAGLWGPRPPVVSPLARPLGTRASVPADPLIVALRDELYAGRYDTIRWEDQRDVLAATDAYAQSTGALAAVNAAVGGYERLALRPLRRRALDECLRHIQYEDRVTQFIRIRPVNAVLNTMVHWFRGAAADVDRSFAALDGYLWDGHDGMKMQGYNSSELWDTAFALQALLAAGGGDDVVAQAYAYVRDNRIIDEV